MITQRTWSEGTACESRVDVIVKQVAAPLTTSNSPKIRSGTV